MELRDYGLIKVATCEECSKDAYNRAWQEKVDWLEQNDDGDQIVHQCPEFDTWYKENIHTQPCFAIEIEHDHGISTGDPYIETLFALCPSHFSRLASLVDWDAARFLNKLQAENKKEGEIAAALKPVLESTRKMVKNLNKVLEKKEKSD